MREALQTSGLFLFQRPPSGRHRGRVLTTVGVYEPDAERYREILSTTPLPPSMPGVYAWFFKETPADVPIKDCVTKSSMTLLYFGISPDKIGKPNSRQNLRRRITTHFRGNAEGSTLRGHSVSCWQRKASIPYVEQELTNV